MAALALGQREALEVVRAVGGQALAQLERRRARRVEVVQVRLARERATRVPRGETEQHMPRRQQAAAQLGDALHRQLGELDVHAPPALPLEHEHAVLGVGRRRYGQEVAAAVRERLGRRSVARRDALHLVRVAVSVRVRVRVRVRLG